MDPSIHMVKPGGPLKTTDSQKQVKQQYMLRLSTDLQDSSQSFKSLQTKQTLMMEMLQKASKKINLKSSSKPVRDLSINRDKAGNA